MTKTLPSTLGSSCLKAGNHLDAGGVEEMGIVGRPGRQASTIFEPLSHFARECGWLRKV